MKKIAIVVGLLAFVNGLQCAEERAAAPADEQQQQAGGAVTEEDQMKKLVQQRRKRAELRKKWLNSPSGKRVARIAARRRKKDLQKAADQAARMAAIAELDAQQQAEAPRDSGEDSDGWTEVVVEDLQS